MVTAKCIIHKGTGTDIMAYMLANMGADVFIRLQRNIREQSSFVEYILPLDSNPNIGYYRVLGGIAHGSGVPENASLWDNNRRSVRDHFHITASASELSPFDRGSII